MRPIMGARVGPNTSLAQIGCKILRAMADCETETYVVKSTEEVLRAFEEYNQKLNVTQASDDDTILPAHKKSVEDCNTTPDVTIVGDDGDDFSAHKLHENIPNVTLANDEDKKLPAHKEKVIFSMDIKSFYPSIDPVKAASVARKMWENCSSLHVVPQLLYNEAHPSPRPLE